MEKEKKPDLNKWDDFSGDYLKCDIVKEFPVTLIPTSIDSEFKEGVPRMAVEVEYNDRVWKLEFNKTNQGIIRSHGLTPKEVVGKKLVFIKTKNRNPTTNAMVDSFLLDKIE